MTAEEKIQEWVRKHDRKAEGRVKREVVSIDPEQIDLVVERIRAILHGSVLRDVYDWKH